MLIKGVCGQKAGGRSFFHDYKRTGQDEVSDASKEL